MCPSRDSRVGNLLVLLHVAGVALGSFRHRENLVASMWHGYRRRLDAGTDR